MSANDDLQDLTIAHAAYVERYKRDVVNRMVGMLNGELEPAVLARLQTKLDQITARGPSTGLHSTARLAALKVAIDEEIAAFTKEAHRLIRAELRQVATAEAKWQASALRKAIPPEITVRLDMPSPATLRAIVTEGPINGALLKDWFKGMEDGTKRAVTKAVNIGLAQGETTQQIVARVRGTKELGFADGAMQGTRRQVSVVVNSAIGQVSTNARRQMIEGNNHLIKGWQVVATLDHKTCVVCGPMDGKFLPLDYTGSRPKFHPVCRCEEIPVLKSWQDLGYNAKDLPVGTRASMDGQVPATVTFSEWLKKRPRSAVEKVLGSRAAATKFLNGELPLDAFSTSMGTPLSLKRAMALAD